MCHLSIAFLVGSADAQDKPELREWAADQEIIARLGEPFADSQISIRAARDLKRVDRPNPLELADRGIFNYGWTPDGSFPNVTNLSVALTPFKQPSAAALDKTVEGMKKSVQRNLQEVQFGDVQKGTFREQEARLGQYTAKIAGEEIIAMFLIGIDDKGTFGVTAMLPKSAASEERAQELKAAILTFERVA